MRTSFIDWPESVLPNGPDPNGPTVARATLLPVLLAQWPHLELEIENSDATASGDALEPLMRPTLTALKISNLLHQDAVNLPRPDPALEDLLYLRPSLRTLHLVCKPDLSDMPILLRHAVLSSVTASTEAKSPALRELLIDTDGENFSTVAVHSLWDFSQLEHLTLYNVHIMDFLASMMGVEFPRLKSFSTDGRTVTSMVDVRRTASGAIYMFIDRSLTLQSIKLRANLLPFSELGLLGMGCKYLSSTLRALDIRDWDGFSTVDSECDTWSFSGLAAIGEHCPKIMEFVMDHDMKIIHVSR